MLKVVTGLYPLAEAARLIGGTGATVIDPVADGANPLTYSPAPFGNSGLVIEVGGGFQPRFEAVARGAPRVLALAVALRSDDAYVWLDPTTMGRAASLIAAAMESADPSAAPLFRQNNETLQAEISSEGLDYSSTLSTCRISTLVTPDSAFTAMAADYGLVDEVAAAGAGQSRLSSIAAAVEQRGLGAVFSEPWVANDGVQAVARMAKVGVRQLDTLAGVPTGGYPRRLDYFALMEKNLSVISSTLACNVNGQ